MSRLRRHLLPLALLLSLAATASAQDTADSRLPQGFDQVVYKGVVGNVLDAIPMDPSKRLDLQRTNAVVGNTLLGRSLTVLAGLSNPVLLLGGFVWGVWAASNIKAAETVTKRRADPGQPDGDAAAQKHLLMLLQPSSAVDVVHDIREPATILASSISAGDSEVSAPSHSHVSRIWLPQRSTTLSR